MTSKRIDHRNIVGRLIAIPTGEGWRLAKVLFASAYFRNVLLLRLLESRSSDPARLLDQPRTESGPLYYTGIQPIRAGRWLLVGVEEVSEAERELSRRTSGGEVWLLDEHLGPASDEDLARLPKMLVHGGGLIEKYAAESSRG